MRKLSVVLYALAIICSAVLCGMCWYYKLGGAMGYLFFWFTVILIAGAVFDRVESQHYNA